MFSRGYVAGPRFGGAEEGEVQHHHMEDVDFNMTLSFLIEGIDARTFVRMCTF